MRWCPTARKVTVGLVTDLSGLSNYGLNGLLKKEDEHPATAYTSLKAMTPFTYYNINLFHCCMHEL